MHCCTEELGINSAAQSMQAHSCAENTLNGLIFLSAGQVQGFSFCWAGTGFFLSLAAIAACIPRSAGLAGGLSPPLTPARFASLAEPFWGPAGISVTEEISN